MIATLRGSLLYINSDRLVVDVNGVGYDVAFCQSGVDLLPSIGRDVFLHIYTNVREDAIALYGFMQLDEKAMFMILLSVSGVGPKVALNILSTTSPSELAASIMTEDLHRLTKLPGVGKKTAERLCLELKDKVHKFAGHSEPSGSTIKAGVVGDVTDDIISALVNLGYPQTQAKDAYAKVVKQLPEGPPQPPIAELLRLTLRSLA